MKIKKILCLILILIASPLSANAKIEDGLFITVGNKAITKSDIVNEIKILLILNNESYDPEKRDKYHQLAIKQAIERNIKQIEIEKLNFLNYKNEDLVKELTKLANRIGMDLDTLKNICASNELDFSIIEEQIITGLLWNSLIFHLYKDRIKINIEEIEEQLKSDQKKKDTYEYLISEIIIKPINKDNPQEEIKELKNKIEINGFEETAKEVSVSESSLKGGDLGWLSENIISEKYISEISRTKLGELAEPIILSEKDILIFKVRDKRKLKRNLEEEKNQLVYLEKTKILQMHASTHYDKIKRSTSINFIKNE